MTNSNDLHTGTLITDLMAAVKRVEGCGLYGVQIHRVEADPFRQDRVVNGVISAFLNELEAEDDMERDRR